MSEHAWFTPVCSSVVVATNALGQRSKQHALQIADRYPQTCSNMSEIDTNSDGEEYSSGDTEGSGVGSSSGSCSYESTGSDSGSRSNESEADSEEEEEIEPVLKYKRFARDVVASISQAHSGHESNVICCMAVHSKVSIAVR